MSVITLDWWLLTTCESVTMVQQQQLLVRTLGLRSVQPCKSALHLHHPLVALVLLCHMQCVHRDL